MATLAWSTSVQFAGDTRRHICAQELSKEKQNINSTLSGVASRIIQTSYGGTDLSRPMCSQNMLWKLDEPWFNRYHSIISDFYYNDKTCKKDAMYDAVDFSNLDNPGKLDRDAWEEVLSAYDRANMLPQAGSTTSNTLIEEITKFITSIVSYELADKIIASGIGVYLDRSVPSILSPEDIPAVDPEPDSSAQSSSTVDGQSTMVCVFKNLAEDPKIPIQPTAYHIRSQPELKPRHVTGFFARTYPSSAIWINRWAADIILFQISPCDQQSARGCAMNYLDTLYSKYKDEYFRTGFSNRFLPPITLPWYNETGFSMQLRPSLDYLGNIMPNKDKSVMCTINTDKPVNLMNCSNPLYQQLKDHISQQMTYNSAPIVPNNAQLEWSVGRSLFSSGVVMAIIQHHQNQRVPARHVRRRERLQGLL